jgi:hypothetical protein
MQEHTNRVDCVWRDTSQHPTQKRPADVSIAGRKLWDRLVFLF